MNMIYYNCRCVAQSKKRRQLIKQKLVEIFCQDNLITPRFYFSMNSEMTVFPTANSMLINLY